MSHIVVTWLLTYLLHSTILLGMAGLAERGGLLKRPGIAETAWRIALCGGIASASAQVLMVSMEVRPAAWFSFVIPSPLGDITALLACLWLAPALVAALQTGLTVLRLNREARNSPLSGNQELAGFLATLCGSIGRAQPRIRITDAWGSPVVLPNGEICMPRWVFAQLTGAQRQAILAHEVAHVLRRDAAWRIAASLIARIGFLQPLNKVAIGRLELLAELHCDDWAARRSGRHDLAEALYCCATTLHTKNVPPLAPAMAAPLSPFRLRIVTLLDGGAAFVPARLRAIPVLLAGALMLLAAASTLPAVAIGIDVMSSHVDIDRASGRFVSRLDGEMAVTAAEDDIVRVSKPMRITELVDGASWRLDVVPGQRTSVYAVGGVQRPLDAAGRAWLARVIPHLLRESGWEAQQRVARLMGLGGDARVLAEIDMTRSLHARGATMRAYLAQAHPTPAHLARLLTQLGSMHDDYAVYRVLLAVAAVMPADQALLLEYRLRARGLGDGWRGKAEKALDHLST